MSQLRGFILGALVAASGVADAGVCPLLIHPVVLSEVDAVLGIFQDKQVQTMSRDEVDRERVLESLSTPNARLFGIRLFGQIIGVGQFYAIPPGVLDFPRDRKFLDAKRPLLAGIGLHLDPKFFGTGIADHALRELERDAFAFDDRIGVLYASVHKENWRSRRFFTKRWGPPSLDDGEFYYFLKYR